MTKTGTLAISNGNSRLDGTLLAIKNGSPDPLGAATNFLVNKGFATGSVITVTGSPGVLGSVPVFFMTDAKAASVTAFTDIAAKKSVAKAVNASVEDSTNNKPKRRKAAKVSTGTKKKAKKKAKPAK